MGEPISYVLILDALNDERAIYTGPNRLAATIDRAAYERNDRPVTVNITVPGDALTGASIFATPDRAAQVTDVGREVPDDAR